MATMDEYARRSMQAQDQGAGCSGEMAPTKEPEDTLPALTGKIIENGRKLLALRPAYQMYVEATEEGNELRARFDRVVKRIAKKE